MEFEHKSGIYMCTCIGNGKSYIGQSKDVKLRSSTINKCCKGVKKTAGGFHWRYATEEEIKFLKQTHIA